MLPRITAGEIDRLAAQMRVADPNSDDGAHEEQRDYLDQGTRTYQWHRPAGEDGGPQGDVQRFDYLFPSDTYSKAPKFDLARLESWPNWKTKLREEVFVAWMMERYDGFEDEEVQPAYLRIATELHRYVTKHFHLLAFTETELQRKQGFSTNPPKGLIKNWIGVKNMMCRATLDLTTKGRLETPCVVYHDTDTSLILEIVDVKRVSWPEPGPKDNSNWPKKSSAKPALVTPRIPLVVVRYSYMETGLVKDGAQFLSHLQSRLRELSPSGFRAGEETPKEHIRIFSRLLSYSADFVDKEWADDQQSHWNIPAKVKTEMRVVPKRSGLHTNSDILYIPARAYISWTLDFGFASEEETVKMGTPSLADAGQGEWDSNQGKVVYYDQGAGTAFLYDRRRSIIMRFGPLQATKAKAACSEVDIPFQDHEAGYRHLKDIPNQQGIQLE
ncbi:hypothetical protein DFH08DRAFT_947925 [Mycena albidolilacea]|uniref:Uncharacterized protein n=1 Tax=Mycena albidolilacea TaxID=1033008 RepID=A0AAD7AW95_9AGAR|nr:hypothetical protein DFH08DRAFT_947925 [Mycena albidolilacea]